MKRFDVRVEFVFSETFANVTMKFVVEEKNHSTFATLMNSVLINYFDFDVIFVLV